MHQLGEVCLVLGFSVHMQRLDPRAAVPSHVETIARTKIAGVLHSRRRGASGRHFIFLVGTTGDDPERFIGQGRCSALASSQGARIQTSRSSPVVRIDSRDLVLMAHNPAKPDLSEVARFWGRGQFRHQFGMIHPLRNLAIGMG
jgi:hypothetical protein